MLKTNREGCSGMLENALFNFIRDAVRAELQEFSAIDRRERLLIIDEAAQVLSVSKDWLYRNAKKFGFVRKLGPKMVRFSESGLQNWLRQKTAI